MVRLWSVAPGVAADNRGSSRTLTQQLTGRPGRSTDHRPVPYNDEVTGSSPVTPTVLNGPHSRRAPAGAAGKAHDPPPLVHQIASRRSRRVRSASGVAG